jgi:hypothetical protein
MHRRLASLVLFAAFVVAGDRAAAAAWRPPVPGEVTRTFDLDPDPYEDIAGRTGTPLSTPAYFRAFASPGDCGSLRR